MLPQRRAPCAAHSNLCIRNPLFPRGRLLRQGYFIALVVDNTVASSKSTPVPHREPRFASRRKVRHIHEIAPAHDLEMEPLPNVHCERPNGTGISDCDKRGEWQY